MDPDAGPSEEEAQRRKRRRHMTDLLDQNAQCILALEALLKRQRGADALHPVAHSLANTVQSNLVEVCGMLAPKRAVGSRHPVRLVAGTAYNMGLLKTSDESRAAASKELSTGQFPQMHDEALVRALEAGQQLVPQTQSTGYLVNTPDGMVRLPSVNPTGISPLVPEVIRQEAPDVAAALKRIAAGGPMFPHATTSQRLEPPVCVSSTNKRLKYTKPATPVPLTASATPAAHAPPQNQALSSSTNATLLSQGPTSVQAHPPRNPLAVQPVRSAQSLSQVSSTPLPPPQRPRPVPNNPPTMPGVPASAGPQPLTSSAGHPSLNLLHSTPTATPQHTQLQHTRNTTPGMPPNALPGMPPNVLPGMIINSRATGAAGPTRPPLPSSPAAVSAAAMNPFALSTPSSISLATPLPTRAHSRMAPHTTTSSMPTMPPTSTTISQQPHTINTTPTSVALPHSTAPFNSQNSTGSAAASVPTGHTNSENTAAPGVPHYATAAMGPVLQDGNRVAPAYAGLPASAQHDTSSMSSRLTQSLPPTSVSMPSSSPLSLLTNPSNVNAIMNHLASISRTSNMGSISNVANVSRINTVSRSAVDRDDSAISGTPTHSQPVSQASPTMSSGVAALQQQLLSTAAQRSSTPTSATRMNHPFHPGVSSPSLASTPYPGPIPSSVQPAPNLLSLQQQLAGMSPSNLQPSSPLAQSLAHTHAQVNHHPHAQVNQHRHGQTDQHSSQHNSNGTTTSTNHQPSRLINTASMSDAVTDAAQRLTAPGAPQQAQQKGLLLESTDGSPSVTDGMGPFSTVQQKSVLPEAVRGSTAATDGMGPSSTVLQAGLLPEAVRGSTAAADGMGPSGTVQRTADASPGHAQHPASVPLAAAADGSMDGMGPSNDKQQALDVPAGLFPQPVSTPMSAAHTPAHSLPQKPAVSTPTRPASTQSGTVTSTPIPPPAVQHVPPTPLSLNAVATPLPTLMSSMLAAKENVSSTSEAKNTTAMIGGALGTAPVSVPSIPVSTAGPHVPTDVGGSSTFVPAASHAPTHAGDSSTFVPAPTHAGDSNMSVPAASLAPTHAGDSSTSVPAASHEPSTATPSTAASPAPQTLPGLDGTPTVASNQKHTFPSGPPDTPSIPASHSSAVTPLEPPPRFDETPMASSAPPPLSSAPGPDDNSITPAGTGSMAPRAPPCITSTPASAGNSTTPAGTGPMAPTRAPANTIPFLTPVQSNTPTPAKPEVNALFTTHPSIVTGQEGIHSMNANIFSSNAAAAVAADGAGSTGSKVAADADVSRGVSMLEKGQQREQQSEQQEEGGVISDAGGSGSNGKESPGVRGSNRGGSTGSPTVGGTGKEWGLDLQHVDMPNLEQEAVGSDGTAPTVRGGDGRTAPTGGERDLKPGPSGTTGISGHYGMDKKEEDCIYVSRTALGQNLALGDVDTDSERELRQEGEAGHVSRGEKAREPETHDGTHGLDLMTNMSEENEHLGRTAGIREGTDIMQQYIHVNHVIPSAPVQGHEAAVLSDCIGTNQEDVGISNGNDGTKQEDVGIIKGNDGTTAGDLEPPREDHVLHARQEDAQGVTTTAASQDLPAPHDTSVLPDSVLPDQFLDLSCMKPGWDDNAHHAEGGSTKHPVPGGTDPAAADNTDQGAADDTDQADEYMLMMNGDPNSTQQYVDQTADLRPASDTVAAPTPCTADPRDRQPSVSQGLQPATSPAPTQSSPSSADKHAGKPEHPAAIPSKPASHEAGLNESHPGSPAANGSTSDPQQITIANHTPKPGATWLSGGVPSEEGRVRLEDGGLEVVGAPKLVQVAQDATQGGRSGDGRGLESTSAGSVKKSSEELFGLAENRVSGRRSPQADGPPAALPSPSAALPFTPSSLPPSIPPHSTTPPAARLDHLNHESSLSHARSPQIHTHPTPPSVPSRSDMYSGLYSIDDTGVGSTPADGRGAAASNYATPTGGLTHTPLAQQLAFGPDGRDHAGFPPLPSMGPGRDSFTPARVPFVRRDSFPPTGTTPGGRDSFPPTGATSGRKDSFTPTGRTPGRRDSLTSPGMPPSGRMSSPFSPMMAVTASALRSAGEESLRYSDSGSKGGQGSGGFERSGNEDIMASAMATVGAFASMLSHGADTPVKGQTPTSHADHDTWGAQLG